MNQNNGHTKTMSNEKNSGKDKEDELARVSILPFEDRTQSNNFRYMAESLSDAILKSMSKDFSYSPIETADIKKSLYEAQQEIIKEKIREQTGKEKKESKNKSINQTRSKKNPEIKKDKKEYLIDSSDAMKTEKSNEEIQLDEEQLILVKKVAQKLSADIVVFGNYTYNTESNEIVFTVTLYLALSDATRELEETRNTVDNTLFRATEKVSSKLVAEIYNMIEEAEKAAAEKSGKKIEPDLAEKMEDSKSGEKVALTKKVAMASTPDWSSKKFSISFSPGFSMNNPPSEGCGTCQLQLSLAGRFWIIPKLYLGITLDGGGITSGSAPFFEVEPSWWTTNGLVALGFGIPANRWLFSADIGAGYFVLFVKDTGPIYNPVFGARVGGEVLLSDNFSMGLLFNAKIYYDDPQPLFFGGMAITLNFVL